MFKIFTKLKIGNVILLLLGLLLGSIFTWFYHKTIINSSCEEIRTGGYEFINPLLECREDDLFKELKPFKAEVQDFVNKIIAKNEASAISVYFRDMNNGPWFGINEKEPFIPASLLKVPVMMAYIKKSETNPEIFKEVIEYKDEYISNFQYVVSEQEVKLGEKHTVDELIVRMIVYSDNVAVSLLTQNSERFGISLQNVYDDLGVSYTLNTNDNMAVKNYASFFRILFNSSYLNRQMSEKALGLLVQTKFKDGIAGGVPANVKVANKFGEKPFPERDSKQLHDCGIVYYPSHPYLLCIMTRGDDFGILERHIRDISVLVYQEVDRQYK